MIDEFVGKTIAEKYLIESLLRDSDLGEIYQGTAIATVEPVTVKILSPAVAIDQRFVERFLAEAKTTAAASHPNLLNVIDFGTDSNNVSYTAYEGAGSETLNDLTARDGALPVPQALDIAKHTASALAATHAQGLIHGSLNADKILFTKDEEAESIKVFDFGAKPISRASNADLAYIAPEQYADAAASDERSDIYSLGVILYEMLTGEVPFVGQTAAELKLKQQEPPAPLSAFRDDLPSDLEPMILCSLAADPERRYQKMSAFAEDLELLSTGIAAPSIKAPAVAAPKKNIWQTAFIVLTGIMLLAGALIYATSTRRTDPTTQTQADPGSLPVQPIGPATGAQEDSLAKLPDMTEAEIMAIQNANMELPPGTLPGGDGFNAWANGGAPPLGAPPPIGAPPPQYVPPGGPVVTVDPNGGSQFMPQDSGIILVPVPVNTNTAVKPTPMPKVQPANGAGQPAPTPAATPKPMATPPTKDAKPATPAADKTVTPGKPVKPSKPLKRVKPKVS